MRPLSRPVIGPVQPRGFLPLDGQVHGLPVATGRCSILMSYVSREDALDAEWVSAEHDDGWSPVVPAGGYHRDWNGELLRRDQLRNMRLIELGWDDMRFWVYQLRDDMPACVQRVREWAKNHRQQNTGI